jgi:hypothetical protein
MNEKFEEMIKDAIDNSSLSECCGAPMFSDIGICTKCRDHCVSITEAEEMEKNK